MSFGPFQSLGQLQLWQGGRVTEGSDHITWACLVSWTNSIDGSVLYFY
jgi:hypothetical protein